MEVLKVSAQSQPKSVAGACSCIKENNAAEVQAVSAGAVNQQFKSYSNNEDCSSQWD